MPFMPDHAYEAERLRLLHVLNILDTPAEPYFDRITRLAARALRAPMCFITFIDESRQWFKSCYGTSMGETSRETAFCAYTIMQDEPMIVEDALQDSRFQDNPLVTGAPYIRFYAGTPVYSSEGFALGALCVLDTKPRTLSQSERIMLEDFAFLVSKEVQLRETLLLTRGHMAHSQSVIEASEARFGRMFERAAVGIAQVSTDARWLKVNTELCRIVGYNPEEFEQLTYWDLTHPDDAAADRILLKQLLNGEIDVIEQERRYLSKQGEPVWVNVSVTKEVEQNGKPEYFVAIVSDIRTRKEAEASLEELRRDLEHRVEQRTQALQEANRQLAASEQALRKREAELSSVIENANDAYVAVNAEGIITAWNRQAMETFGWTPEEAIGSMMDDLIVPPDLRERHRLGMQRYLTTGNATVLGQRLELPALRRDGSVVPVEVRLRALNHDGQIVFSAFLHDISERKLAEQRREYEARYDVLTGLFNRRALIELLPRAMARAERQRVSMALLFLDLDGFKAVNDSQGHDAGDALLQEIARRLQKGIRQSDEAIRLGGDEFTVILENLAEAEADARQDACRLAEKLLESICRPVALVHGEAFVSASIGITLYRPGSGCSPDDLIRAADKAMYEAKRTGKSRVYLL
ncbi:PAS domain S-box-containing protein/diguanylate cyclase (GGDEF)-like protein [Pseudomonas duriflava]|uniref:PAS domain S-box-containing protein/diguanylate cyclase (GGDEF)-like protein n=1 Tax=Pseudomonas duriflava TaxID=459528 RepID=A0A562QE16_9PSED|nr:PAS domain S-box protein [Pseudomonas duriflava]TWI55015.1 PAS domain S-box-containing protein/diguanylate cyclase (GGDEF)-like protein [Pseudomonas duriflava]